ncbi:hypothetical protein [Roseospira visakhapatnamensis]|uniref:Uncharacterized protein n=1 Tax=Roseospira visakhapatnamensis TaxID=390880 RepID=A0A7W6WBK5_9PROT|nr:hypothetical protein [Roseospira visakhapatnamensis]MBB4267621.1 hypothetical protein [Roseospira visakhapatnamensis]
MTTKNTITALRDRSYSLVGLPDTVLVPGLPGRRDEAVKPVETVTLDDIAFALLALQEKSSAIYREAEALRMVYDLARKNGALGADIALDAIPVETEGKW